MDNTGYIAIGHQVSMQRRLEIIANNLANMNTAGYKAEHPLFEEFLQKTDRYDRSQEYSYVVDIGSYRDLTDGNVEKSNNDLDIAISGEGWLQVETENGPRYTRAGRTALGPDGTLMNHEGLPILDPNGARILVDPSDPNITIAKDGTISTATTGVIGQIGVFTFEEPQRLLAQGTTLYDALDQQPQPATDAVVLQGHLEGSNVNPMLEITDMIRVQRQYDAAMRMIETDHRLEKESLINRVGRVR